jgi:hypothetical protein
LQRGARLDEAVERRARGAQVALLRREYRTLFRQLTPREVEPGLFINALRPRVKLHGPRHLPPLAVEVAVGLEDLGLQHAQVEEL